MIFDTIGSKSGYRASIVFLGVLALLWMLPILFMLSLSLQNDELLVVSTANLAWGLLPYPFTIENFQRLLGVDNTLRWFLNSALVSVVSTTSVLLISALAGYAFARLKFYGRNILYAFVIAGLMIPSEGTFISLYTLFSDWQAHNTYFSLIVPNLAVPLGTILMTQFFKGIPEEFEEAAQLDGANHWYIFTRIMLPLSVPALTTLGIITFLATWNSFLWPLVTTQENEMFTITVGLATTQQGYTEENLGRIMAQGVIASFPVVMVFLIFQKNLVKGIVMQSK